MELITLKGTNLNTTVYRGFATIRDITTISAPDVLNQDTNPEGLQRDLSEKHAREGYRYAEGSIVVPDHPRLWPEVILNVRAPEVVDIEPIDEGMQGLYKIIVNEDKINKESPHPQISRTDGNHRLHFGLGDPGYEWPALDVSTPFSLAIGLSPEQEACLFMDINDNQKAMNTSHLAHLKARLSEEERLAMEDPALWIAKRLAESDPKSPLYGLIYLGGEKPQGATRKVNLAALRTGVQMILKESVKLRAFDEIEPKYVLIRAFWNAVAAVFSQEWLDTRRYLLLRGFGLWSMSILGAEIIDRCITRHIGPDKLGEEMASYLRQTRMVVDWDANEGNVKGYGGRVGARNLAEIMKRALSDEELDMGRMARALTSNL